MPGFKRRSRPGAEKTLSIPQKAKRVLAVFLLALFIIFLRIWHLGVVQKEERTIASRRPMQRTVIEPSHRATIRDRFNIPLAINKNQYNIAVCYSQIREIPGVVWIKGEDGKKVKHYKRKEYIRSLAEILAKELDLNADHLEDIIHAKAALYDHLPFIIKRDVSEKQYYRMRMLMRDWPGLEAQHIAKRHYPKEQVAADLVGYMGAIDKQEYDRIVAEKKELKAFVQQQEYGLDPEIPEGFQTSSEARFRLRDLEEKAYTLNDFVGKSGVESFFEEDLRGFHGKLRYYSDSKGNHLRELPGSSSSLPGKRLLLSISSELQQYAEELLIQNEPMRKIRINKMESKGTAIKEPKEPWIKGGAIVAMDPNNGEVLALASCPRFNPNDFIPSGNPEVDTVKRQNIRRWFETDTYLIDIWEGKSPLTREKWNKELEVVEEENIYVDWEKYLEIVLVNDSPVSEAMGNIHTLNELFDLNTHIDRLLEVGEGGDMIHLLNTLYHDEDGHIPQNTVSPAKIKELTDKRLAAANEINTVKQHLDVHLKKLPHTYDKILFIDLCRLAIDNQRFSKPLLHHIGHHTIKTFQSASQAKNIIDETIKKMARELFHEVSFLPWRANNEKSFLKAKRDKERKEKRPTKPFTDYLEKEEEAQFHEFWQENRHALTLLFLTGARITSHEDDLKPYIEHFTAWNRELAHGAHSGLSWHQAHQTLRKLLIHLPPSVSLSYLQAMRSYQDLSRPIVGKYRYIRNKNEQQTEKDLALAFYPLHGYGFARSTGYRQATPLGSLFKLITSYEALVQKYKTLSPDEITYQSLNPLTMIDQTHRLGKGWSVGFDLSGKSIPLFYKGGILPRSMSRQIGKVDLIKALEKSSNPYFSLLAGDFLEKPTDLLESAKNFSLGTKTGIELSGEISGRLPDDLEYNQTGLYSFAIGQHAFVVTPLQTAVMLSALANGGSVLKPKIVTLAAGTTPLRQNNDLFSSDRFPYQNALQTVGIDFPLFITLNERMGENRVFRLPSIVWRKIPMPSPIRNLLLEAMDNIAGRSRSALVKKLKGELVGKTSTAESVESLCLDRLQHVETYNHVWFGSILFDEEAKENTSEEFIFKDRFGKPELVVVVYLRFGSYGRDAAPLAAQVAKKWREIKKAKL